MKITEGAIMRVRDHKEFGHGLRPGTDRDINCLSCIREDGSPENEQHETLDQYVAGQARKAMAALARTGH